MFVHGKPACKAGVGGECAAVMQQAGERFGECNGKCYEGALINS